MTEQLDTPGHDSVDPGQNEDAVPHPQDGEHLVIIIIIFIIIVKLLGFTITNNFLVLFGTFWYFLVLFGG